MSTEKKEIVWNKIEKDAKKSLSSEDKEEKFSSQNKLKKFRPLFFIAFVLTALQFFLFMLFSPSVELGNTSSAVPIAIIKYPLAKGRVLSEENVTFSYQPVGDMEAAYITSKEFHRYLGRRVRLDIAENTPLLKGFIFSDFQESSVPEKIPPGYRLFILDVSLGNLSNILKQGDRVDIIANLNIPNLAQATETLLEAIEVRGIGENIENVRVVGSSHFDSISFFVTPEEFKLLSFVKQYAVFSLALRNPNDLAEHKSNAITLNNLLSDERIQKIMNDEKFKIIRGGKK